MENNEEKLIKTYKELFGVFLDDTDTKDLYEKNHAYHCINLFVEEENPKYYITSAFCFERTDEGCDFWLELHREWLLYIAEWEVYRSEIDWSDEEEL